MRRNVIIIILLFLARASSSGALATTISPNTCSQADVQAAIDQAVDGDTVQVPAGQCSWSSTVRIFRKGIVLRGSGSDVTTIIDATPHGGPSPVIRIDAVEGKPFRITGFTFHGATGWEGIISIFGTTDQFRIDHCNFQFTSNLDNRGIRISGYMRGVIDNCQFLSDFQAVSGLWVGSDGFNAWARPYIAGSGDAVFIEDSEFRYAIAREGAPVVDAKDGSKIVFRYNTVHNSNIAQHGLGGNGRSTQALEIYGNHFSNNSQLSRAIFLRGGTAVIFDNSLSGGWSHLAVLSSYRSCCSVLPCGSWRDLDSVPEKLCSVRKNEACHTDADCSDGGQCNVQFCSETKDQLCTNDGQCPSGETCSGYLDGHEDATGYPGRDQIGRVAGQLLVPVYEWDNTLNGGDTDMHVPNPVGCLDPLPTDHIKENRDYLNDTLKPGYQPFPYPHPLREELAPAPPAGARERTSSPQG